MDIVINFSVRRDGQRALVVSDIIVRDAFFKEPEEVIAEIQDKLSDAVDLAFEEVLK